MRIQATMKQAVSGHRAPRGKLRLEREATPATLAALALLRQCADDLDAARAIDESIPEGLLPAVAAAMIGRQAMFPAAAIRAALAVVDLDALQRALEGGANALHAALARYAPGRMTAPVA